ncbi:MAG: SUMF1/EgtB/PvdO family nonheme iron enzyme [Myxococcota bacterium]|nr:SUMF1/EgtB/PvdO family nonheme iron enzyme [Myxococcota bacterium]
MITILFFSLGCIDIPESTQEQKPSQQPTNTSQPTSSTEVQTDVVTQSYESLGCAESFLSRSEEEDPECLRSGSGVTLVYTKIRINSSEANHAEGQFYIMQTEVTQGLYEKVMGVNPVKNCTTKLNKASMDPKQPVYCVSFEDALRFANALSEKASLTPCYTFEEKGPRLTNNLKCDGFRLPTKIEWTGVFDPVAEQDISDQAWFMVNSQESTHPVATKSPNRLGLYDISGNVAEWIWRDEGQSPYTSHLLGEKRMAIGGSAGDTYINLQPDTGRFLMRDEIDEGTGFRLLRTHR